MLVDSLINARWIIPVEPENCVLDHHALVIHQGRIIDLLPQAEASERYQANRVDNLAHHVLIPGLVNAHTHAAMSLMRGLADDLPLMEWLEQHIWPVEQKWVSESFVRDGTELAIAEMIRGGTTCFNDMYFFPDIVAHVASRVGMRACVGLLLIDFPTVWAKDVVEYLDKGAAVFDEYADNPLISAAFAPHAPYSVSDGSLEKMQIYVGELNLPIHMHVHETAFEVTQALKSDNNRRPLHRLADLGLLGPEFMAVHMTQLNDDDIQLIADYNAHVVHCPESNLKLASGFCPVQRLIDAGINVALGTDGAASNNDLDMLGEMRCAALLAKGVAQNPQAVPAHIALNMATINGARALGLESEIGSLVAGKSADVVALDLSRIETTPMYDVISQLVYAANREQVSDVWIAGKRVLQHHELTTLDEQKILKSANQWQQKIQTSQAH